MTAVYKQYRDRLNELIAKQGAKLQEIRPIQAELDEVNAQINELQARANELAERKSSVLGGQAWLDLKKEIGMLSRLVSGRK